MFSETYAADFDGLLANDVVQNIYTVESVHILISCLFYIINDVQQYKQDHICNVDQFSACYVIIYILLIENFTRILDVTCLFV